MLTDKERKQGIASLRGTAYSVEGDLAAGLKRLRQPRLLAELRNAWLEIGEELVEGGELPRRPKLPKKLDATGFALAALMVSGVAPRDHRSPLVRAAKV